MQSCSSTLHYNLNIVVQSTSFFLKITSTDVQNLNVWFCLLIKGFKVTVEKSKQRIFEDKEYAWWVLQLLIFIIETNQLHVR